MNRTPKISNRAGRMVAMTAADKILAKVTHRDGMVHTILRGREDDADWLAQVAYHIQLGVCMCGEQFLMVEACNDIILMTQSSR